MLPHRFPFLLVDRVVEFDPKEGRVVTIKNVTANEPQFMGHFPGAPVMPGVLIIEAMAQSCAFVALSRLPDTVDRNNSIFYFAGINKARFKRVVVPGDQLVIEGKFVRSKMGIGIFDAVARVDGKVACEAEMMCAYRPKPGARDDNKRIEDILHGRTAPEGAAEPAAEPKKAE